MCAGVLLGTSSTLRVEGHHVGAGDQPWWESHTRGIGKCGQAGCLSLPRRAGRLAFISCTCSCKRALSGAILRVDTACPLQIKDACYMSSKTKVIRIWLISSGSNFIFLSSNHLFMCSKCAD